MNNRIKIRHSDHIYELLYYVHRKIVIKNSKIKNYSSISNHIHKFIESTKQCIQVEFRYRNDLKEDEKKELLNVIKLCNFYKKNGIIKTLSIFINDDYLKNRKNYKPIKKETQSSRKPIFETISSGKSYISHLLNVSNSSQGGVSEHPTFFASSYVNSDILSKLNEEYKTSTIKYSLSETDLYNILQNT